jgi:23S rRNA-/tRNA-specific pseudouridylate synthase
VNDGDGRPPLSAVRVVELALREGEERETERGSLCSKENNDSSSSNVKQQQEQQQQCYLTRAAELIELGSVWYLPASSSAAPPPHRDDDPDPTPAAAPPAPVGSAGGGGATTTKKKPERLTVPDQVLRPGDYVRIHPAPRRFPAVRECDWSRRRRRCGASTKRASGDGDGDDRPSGGGVIVERNAEKGWMVIDKPANVPVHSTVDNCRENVTACLRKAAAAAAATRDDDDSSNDNSNRGAEPYISTAQRLDHGTSGLLVVSTSLPFARYFARLLQTKTARQLEDDHRRQGRRTTTTTTRSESSSPSSSSVAVEKEGTEEGGVHKRYRCLVCLLPPSDAEDVTNWSVQKAVSELRSHVSTGEAMRHYLEPSVRAPKRFSAEREADDWAECLLRIVNVGRPCALVGSAAGQNLAEQLWRNEDGGGNNERSRMPPTCQAVVELEVELLTGRTHQIRGQLAASGFPLVGDVVYGGAIDASETSAAGTPGGASRAADRLALQCCGLEFLDPDLVVVETKSKKKKKKQKNDENVIMRPSDRWNQFWLDEAWWTPFLQQYEEEQENVAPEEATTTLISGLGLIETPPAAETSKQVATSQGASRRDGNNKPARPDLLPPRVSLSPGKNKYVLIRATHPNDEQVQWFVKSAAPHECGGPYHGKLDTYVWLDARKVSS